MDERRTVSAGAGALLAAAVSALEAARRHLDEASHGRRAAEDRLATLKAVREAHVAALHAVDVRAAALETTLAAREAGGESARRALEAANVAPKGVLADHFDAAAGFEKALDAALGSALEAPVLETRSALDAALARRAREEARRGAFRPPAPGDAVSAEAEGPARPRHRARAPRREVRGSAGCPLCPTPSSSRTWTTRSRSRRCIPSARS